MKTSFIVLGLLMGLSAATEVNIESSAEPVVELKEPADKKDVKSKSVEKKGDTQKPVDKKDTKGDKPVDKKDTKGDKSTPKNPSKGQGRAEDVTTLFNAIHAFVRKDLKLKTDEKLDVKKALEVCK